MDSIGLNFKNRNKRTELIKEVQKILAPKEDDGLAEQRDKDLEECSLNAKEKKQ
jgi:hypothetical protein